ncbi:CK1/CK1/CK1-D protein kinase [Artomyces pyxidatus]|uniref:CK1/CK1/CK1-D protein kinase n=1 Tax=Artomyces pyxidatus TaxID=48021 RepID=A0ACB8SGR2_9AGAM|nr:CK1/CK1/CK1-D protein kinase [Artomyces pyxidatus]
MAGIVVNKRIGGRFRLKKKIGVGSYGEVYEAVDIITTADVAVKLEPINLKRSSLEDEITVYKNLASVPGIPRARWFGAEDGYDTLVMDLLGPSLESTFLSCGRSFGQKKVFRLADQMLAHVEQVHNRDYIHRDLKPSNFLFGRGQQGQQIFLIDFGLATRYRNARTDSHIPYRDGRPLIGTARWASIRVHLGIEQSRRDDLESLAYIFIYLLRGNLPWQALVDDDDILRRKQLLSPEILCKDLPYELSLFLSYVRGLPFEEKPDYAYLHHLLHSACEHQDPTTPIVDLSAEHVKDAQPLSPLVSKIGSAGKAMNLQVKVTPNMKKRSVKFTAPLPNDRVLRSHTRSRAF